MQINSLSFQANLGRTARQAMRHMKPELPRNHGTLAPRAKTTSSKANGAGKNPMLATRTNWHSKRIQDARRAARQQAK